MIECLALSLLAIMVQSEAPHESYEGKVAVAYVAMNRAQQSGQDVQYGQDVVTVLRQPHQFSLDPRVRVSEASWQAARTAFYRLVPDPTHGADHFYNPLVKPWPSWYDERYMTVRIGRHTFLKLGGF